ncbi:MAG: CPBP family intramembrane metalloprotease [Thermoanaerobaculaceae bacterium]|nr:CPBP family intramembrane metalloprotease [Thermoanaerobaculaceae bacterium]
MRRFETSISLKGLLSGENLKPTLILLWAPLVLTTWRYYAAGGFFPGGAGSGALASPAQAAELYAFLSSFVLLGLVSLAIVRLVFREPLAAFGLALGDWRFGLKALAVMAPVMAVLGALASRAPEFVAQYPLYRGACASAPAFLAHAAAYLAYYIGFEVFFRGFVQFGLRESLGDWYAILVQTALSCLVHIGKPSGEIYGAVVGGLVFGIVAFRSRSLLYVIVAHWVLGVALDLFICLG